jgi:aryl sulfotransferase
LLDVALLIPVSTHARWITRVVEAHPLSETLGSVEALSLAIDSRLRYWSHLSNVQSWWHFRHLPNIQLVHYADMLENTEREIRRIAAFLEIDVPERAWPAILQAVSFAEMKRQGERYAPGGGQFWKGGASTFLHKGTNGRWRDVLSDEEMSLYDAACKRALTPECREWLENGGAM